MREPHFLRLELERLEEVALPNMLWTGTSPFLFLDGADSELPALVGQQDVTGVNHPAQLRNSIALPSSEPTPTLVSAAFSTAVHTEVGLAIGRPAIQTTLPVPATDDLTDPANVDLFGIDLLVSSKAHRQASFGGDSSKGAGTAENASNTTVANTGGSGAAGNQGFSGGSAGSLGSLSLPNNPAFSAQVLLPRANAFSSLQPTQGSQQIGPGFASGPNIVGIGLTLQAPSYVPVNADNDNNSMPVTNGIPPKRDFSVNPLNVNDPELLQGNVTLAGPNNGIWETNITPSGAGRIALWIDPKKTAPFSPPGNFYVEGVHESSKLNDVTLQFVYTYGGVSYPVSATLTVTPLIQSFNGSAPSPPPNGRSVWFSKGPANDNRGGALNALLGMTTLSPAPYPGYGWGIQFNAKLTDTNLSGNPVFIQNLTDVKNGVIGPTTNSRGQEVGATFTPDSNPLGQDFVISPAAQQQKPPAAFPLLDTPTDTGNPEYPLVASGTSNDGNTATIQAVDTPVLDHTSIPQDGTAIDVRWDYRLYLVWKYPSGIYYPLGYYNWWVDWYATASGAPNKGPVDTIQYPSAVYTDATWVPDNRTPGKMIGPIANGNLVWQ